MGKSAKFFKRPTRKEKTVLSLTKSTETSLFDSAISSSSSGRKSKKDILSATANPTIAKATTAHPPKASLAYKMQMNGGIKQAVKDLDELNDDWVSEDEDMGNDTPKQTTAAKKKTSDLDKSKPRPDYVELMYGKQGGNKRKTFMPKPALIK
ncbi:hypothetical protein CPC16_000899 [Podila verticillata]|nr:hypothetical protein CPC16_000899 [Podila verticillata]